MISTPNTARLLLNAREAAASLSISERTLWTHSHPRGSIPVVKIGCRTLYAVENLQAWIQKNQAGEA